MKIEDYSQMFRALERVSVGKMKFDMDNGKKEVIEVFLEDEEYSVIFGNTHKLNEEDCLGVMLSLVNLLKGHGHLVWNTIPDEIMERAKRELIILNLK